MSTSLSEATILVPVNAKEPGTPSPSLIKLLGPHSVIVLGYYPVPDQSSTDQLRSQFGEEVTAEVAEIASQFEGEGGSVESVVVFTRDRNETIDNIAAEYEADAVLTTGIVSESLDTILVPLRGDQNLGRIVAFISLLARNRDTNVTLFNVAESEADAPEGEFILRGASDRLEEDGIDPEHIEWKQVIGDSPSTEIIDAAGEYDLLVVGESEPSLRERILGAVTNEVIRQSPRPVLVVRSN